MNRHVKLTDGTVYPVSLCGATNDMLSLTVTQGTLLDLVMVFGVHEKVATIEHWYDGTETDHVFYKGYTELRVASQTRDGVTLMLYIPK